MSAVLDCRGLSCPEPVLLTRKALQEAGSGKVKVIVDNKTALNNVTRAARQLGWSAALEEAEGEFTIEFTK